MEGDVITMTDLFVFEHLRPSSTGGDAIGELRPTGLRPRFSTRLSDRGLEIPPRVLGLDDGGLGGPLRNGLSQ